MSATFKALICFLFLLLQKIILMYRSHTNGELNATHINKEVTLAGWVQKTRDKGFMI